MSDDLREQYGWEMAREALGRDAEIERRDRRRRLLNGAVIIAIYLIGLAIACWVVLR